jgi:nuclear GTP-binding protein
MHIDLVPKPIMEKWLKYLRHDFPCIAFKCSTQNQRKRMGMTASKNSQCSYTNLFILPSWKKI